MRLYLIRHCEFVGQVEDRYSRIADFSLTEKGKEQAYMLGKQLQSVHLQAIFSSPLARAYETAAIIAQELTPPLPIMVIKDLQERNVYGILSGVKRSEATKLFQHVLKKLHLLRTVKALFPQTQHM
ncbi:histidine phosphatase family protein [Ktedonosporobacter rubrisoli]|uniref:Histidine phosphatase family protein n=1 Tax=Ktedonosporobacter rubrisoli TaxID=2509675 RepID=A0A4P6JKA8_KTERU|nr:histidine phosphatase family protein [Ktedonosporobacter rubrisoli]QBD75584.1 histidine phosphatase family protein [Ktedonosporobacter rubrisoli]